MMDVRPLFEKLTCLILSLNATQKRNFKLYAKSHIDLGTPRYIRLFDLINKVSANPDFEENLVEYVLQKKVLRIHELSQVANYLYYKILESMRRIPETHKVRIEIVNILQDCRFLISKEMFDEGWKELQKANALLKKHDYPELELELLLLERRLNGAWRRERMEQRLTEVHGKVEGVLKRLQKDNEVFYQNIHLLNSFVFSKPLIQDANVAAHRYMLELKSEEQPFGIRYRMLLAVANYHRLSAPKPMLIPPFELVKPSKEEEYAHLLELVRLMQTHREQVKEDPSNFLEILVRYLSSAIDMGRWDDFYRYNLHLEQYKNTLEFYRNATYLQLLAFIRREEYQQASIYIVEHQLKEKLFQPQYHVRPSRLTTICFYCTLISLAGKKAEETIFWLEKIIAHKPADSMPGLRCAAYFLRILVVANSPVLSGRHNTERWITMLRQWLIAHNFQDNYFEVSIDMLSYFCAETLNRSKALELLQQLKAQRTINDQMGSFTALAESYLLSKPFEETFRPYL